MDVQPPLLALLRSAVTGSAELSTTAVCPDRYAQARELAGALGEDWWALLLQVPQEGLPWMNDVRPWLDRVGLAPHCVGISPHREVLFPFCCAHVSRTLPLYARAFPGDDRLHRAVAVACRFAEGDASRAALRAAQEGASAVEVEADWLKQQLGRLVVTLCQQPEDNNGILSQLHNLSVQVRCEVAADDAVGELSEGVRAVWREYRGRMSRYQMLSAFGEELIELELGSKHGAAWRAAKGAAEAARLAAGEAERRVLWGLLVDRLRQHAG